MSAFQKYEGIQELRENIFCATNNSTKAFYSSSLKIEIYIQLSKQCVLTVETLGVMSADVDKKDEWGHSSINPHSDMMQKSSA